MLPRTLCRSRWSVLEGEQFYHCCSGEQGRGGDQYGQCGGEGVRVDFRKVYKHAVTFSEMGSDALFNNFLEPPTRLLNHVYAKKYFFFSNKQLTQYCVYRDCHGWSSIIAIHKEILVFTFSFNLNLSSMDIKVENKQKVTACKKVSENVP